MVRKLVEAGATLILVDIKPEKAARQILDEWKIPSPVVHLFLNRHYGFRGTDPRSRANPSTASPPLIQCSAMQAVAGCIPFATTSEADYDRIFRFNYFAQVNLARAVFAQWIERKIAGHLIFTSSYVARMPHTQIPSYASAKAALESFARCMALEYAHTGIRVNVVSPGNVAAGSSLKVFDEDPAYREFVLRVSLGRRNTPESIADAFVFLCSPLANEINGQILSPDYGAGIGNRL